MQDAQGCRWLEQPEMFSALFFLLIVIKTVQCAVEYPLGRLACVVALLLFHVSGLGWGASMSSVLICLLTVVPLIVCLALKGYIYLWERWLSR
jgi:hypothetical protein